LLANSRNPDYLLPTSEYFVTRGGASMALATSTRQMHGVTIVDCAGRLVFGEETSKFRELVKGLIPQHRNITINLDGVSYIDSGGLGTLVSLYTTARREGARINLAQLNKRVIDLLQITKLITVFDTYDKVDDAVRAFGSRASA
jgi:anti-sigma B factor antagonist